MTFLERIGLALAAPRWGLTVAVDRKHAGRAGSDLIRALVVVLVATQLSGLVVAGWLAVRISFGTGVNALVRVLANAWQVDLGFLVISSLLLFALSGPKRALGRAFDLACVAAIPVLAVDLLATGVIRALDLDEPPPMLRVIVSGIAFAWAGAILALALRPARIAPLRVPEPPELDRKRARIAGRAIAVVAVLAVAVQGLWIARNLDYMRPLIDGDPAPPIALPEIGGSKTYTIEPGRVVVLDFWATWCGPCLRSMPALNAIAKARPDVLVLAVNLDNAVEARKLFDREGYKSLILVEDAGSAADRYGVQAIPHTVVIDKRGFVRGTLHGGDNVEAAIDALR
ncbi:MAG TPA: TlpA disulfide reductase family protein [Kofleriaceae bacterium]